MNTPPDEQARALAAWLDGPADAPPPTELDGKVAEAIGVFDPARVPAPELDLDALLGSLLAGPLAAERGQVVAFPSRPRWGRWVTGGGSLLAVAAATLLMVRSVGMPELTDAALLAKDEPREQLSAKKATPAEELADSHAEAKEDVAVAAAPAPPPPAPLARPADYAQQRQSSTGSAAIQEAPVTAATVTRAASMSADPLRKLHQLAEQHSYLAFHRLAEQTLAAGHLTQPQLIELLELQGDVYEAEGRVREALAVREQAQALR